MPLYAHLFSISSLPSVVWLMRRCLAPGSQLRKSWTSRLLFHLLLTSSDGSSWEQPMSTWPLRLMILHQGEVIDSRKSVVERFQNFFKVRILLNLQFKISLSHLSQKLWRWWLSKGTIRARRGRWGGYRGWEEAWTRTRERRGRGWRRREEMWARTKRERGGRGWRRKEEMWTRTRRERGGRGWRRKEEMWARTRRERGGRGWRRKEEMWARTRRERGGRGWRKKEEMWARTRREKGERGTTRGGSWGWDRRAEGGDTSEGSWMHLAGL